MSSDARFGARDRAQRQATALRFGREAVLSGYAPTVAIKEYVVGKSKRRVKALIIGKPFGGRILSDPAVSLAYRIKAALRPPDPMPELRRRLRELRGGA